MTRAARKYTTRVMSLMAVYAVLLVLSITMLKEIHGGSWRYAIAAMPVIPLLFVVWSAIHFVRQMDELQKSIHMEAVTFSFLVTTVITLSYGFLENAGLPRVPLMYVPVLMCALWGIGAGIASRRYR